MPRQNNGGKSPAKATKKPVTYDSKNIRWAESKISKSLNSAVETNKIMDKTTKYGFLPTTSNYKLAPTPKGGVVTKKGVTEYSNGRAYRHSDGAKGNIKNSPSTGIMKPTGKGGELEYSDLGASKYQWDSYDESRVKPIKKYTNGTGKLKGDTSGTGINPNTRPSYNGQEYSNAKSVVIPKGAAGNKYDYDIRKTADGSNYYEPKAAPTVAPRTVAPVKPAQPVKTSVTNAPANIKPEYVPGKKTIRIPSSDPRLAHDNKYATYKTVTRDITEEEEDTRLSKSLNVRSTNNGTKVIPTTPSTNVAKLEKGGIIGKIFKGKKAKDVEARETKSNELAAKTKEGLAKISAPKVESTKGTGVSFKSEAVEYKPKYDTSKGGTVAVAKYQEKLNKETGSNLAVDGIWGDKTDAAYSKSLVKKNKESKVTAKDIGATTKNETPTNTTSKTTPKKNKLGGTQHGDNVFYDNGRVHNTKTGKSGNWKQGEGSKRHITYATKTTSNTSGKAERELPQFLKGDTAQDLAERAGRYGDNDDAGFAVGKAANEVRKEGQGKGWGVSDYAAAAAGVGITALGAYATKRGMKMSKPMTAKATTLPMTKSTASSTAPAPTGYARPVARQHGPMQATTNKQLKNGVVATNNKGKAVKPSNFEKVSNNIKNAKNSFKDKSNVNMAKFERAEMQSRMRASERLEKAEVKPMSKSTTSKGKKTTSKKK